MRSGIGQMGLLGASQIDSKKKLLRGKKKLLASKLMLTSLIDAFSILVIYLLVNFSTSEQILYLSKNMELPSATKTEDLQRNIVVKVEKDQFFIENQPIEQKSLVRKLVELRQVHSKQPNEKQKVLDSITIQADRRQSFQVLSKAIQASGHAGFTDIHFAVLQY